MASAQLSANARNDGGKGVARKLRSAGRVPAVVYGHGRDPQPLSVDNRELERLLAHISAENTVIDLAVDGKSSRTLIREIQRHPFKRQILHVDFQELVAGEKVIVRVPIVLIGIPEGVRMDGGVMDQTLRELEVEVDPSEIPNHLEFDVTKLGIGASVHVSDIPLPPGVEVVDSEGDASVCVISAPRAAVEAVATEEGDESDEPEVIRAKKDDEGEGDEK